MAASRLHPFCAMIAPTATSITVRDLMAWTRSFLAPQLVRSGATKKTAGQNLPHLHPKVGSSQRLTFSPEVVDEQLAQIVKIVFGVATHVRG